MFVLHLITINLITIKTKDCFTPPRWVGRSPAHGRSHSCVSTWHAWQRHHWILGRHSPPGRELHQTIPPAQCKMGEETNAAAILPIHHPVDGVGRLLTMAAPKPVGHKNLFPAEANDHVLLQNLTAAAVLLTAAATIRLCRPHNLQYHVHGADGGHRGAVGVHGGRRGHSFLGAGRQSSNLCLLGRGNRGTCDRSVLSLPGIVVRVAPSAGGAIPCGFGRHFGG
jgi:hypothetical protein